MEVMRIGNEEFTSNVYVLSKPMDSKIWLVDAGHFESLKPLLENKIVAGVFLTHAHYDHIYGINEIQDRFPQCMIYCSSYTHESLYSERMNLSFYHENTVVYKGNSVVEWKEGSRMEIFAGRYMEAFETPGHNEGSLTFRIGNYLFTGDSFIPGIPVVTKLKGGSKESNERSLNKIHTMIHPDTRICSGHGPAFLGKDIQTGGMGKISFSSSSNIELIE